MIDMVDMVDIVDIVEQCGTVRAGPTAQHSHTVHTVRCGPHRRMTHTGLVMKRKRKKSDHGRTVFFEHGVKSGMAMIKYPGYRKNAQGQKRALYPGLTIVSLDRVITYMPYYHVLAYLHLK